MSFDGVCGAIAAQVARNRAAGVHRGRHRPDYVAWLVPTPDWVDMPPTPALDALIEADR